MFIINMSIANASILLSPGTSFPFFNAASSNFSLFGSIRETIPPI